MKNKKLGLVFTIIATLMATSCNTSESASNVGSLPDTGEESTPISGEDSSTTEDSSGTEEVVKITGVQNRRTFTNYNQNKSEHPENKRIEFFDREQTYKVGTENNFNMKPIVTFVNDDFEDVYPESWKYNLDLFLVENSEEKPVADINQYLDSYDNINCDLDFNESAIGKTFKAKITPEETTKNVSMTFEVVKGYNVYKVEELSYFDNRASSGNPGGEAWYAFKKAKGLRTDYAPETLIFHEDLKLTMKDIPNYFYYDEADSDLKKSDPDYERVIGSMRDRIFLYTRAFGDNVHDFTIYGNYFNLDCSALAPIVRTEGQISQEGDIPVSHSVVFYSDPKTSLEAGINENDVVGKFGSFTMRDLKIFGNAPRSENAVKSGGMCFHKNGRIDATMENLITNCWFETFGPLLGDGEYNVSKCKAYDNFSDFLYSWGASNVSITDSEMIGAGGPVIIADHCYKNGNDVNTGYISNIKVTNSKLESIVSGSEGWFQIFNGSELAMQIKSMNAAFSPFGKSFVKNINSEATGFNFISLSKDGMAEGISTTPINGKISIDDVFKLDFGTHDSESDPGLKGFVDTVYTSAGSPMVPIFLSGESHSSNLGYSYLNPEIGLIGMDNNPIMDPNHPVFKGQYLGMIIAYMGVVFEYFE